MTNTVSEASQPVGTIRSLPRQILGVTIGVSPIFGMAAGVLPLAFGEPTMVGALKTGVSMALMLPATAVGMWLTGKNETLKQAWQEHVTDGSQGKFGVAAGAALGLLFAGITYADERLDQHNLQRLSDKAAEAARISRLPSLDAGQKIIIQRTSTPREEYCTQWDIGQGNTIAVKHEGREMQLNCKM